METQDQEKNARWRAEVEEDILPEKQVNEEEGNTPSGKCRMKIRWYTTGEGSWDYSRGTVIRISDGKEICDIVRDYSQFRHSFVQKNGTEYLITGRSYMSQTIVNLETGAEMEPDNFHYQGMAFCWTGAVLSPDGNTLLVDGCHWGCPYEFRFYDFTDPEAQGWAPLPIVTLEEWEKHKDQFYDEEGDFAGFENDLEADNKEPDFHADGTITVYESDEIRISTGEHKYDIPFEHRKDVAKKDWKENILTRHRMERRGNLMVILDTWKSEYQLEKERKRMEYRDKEDADFKRWKATDEMLKMVRVALEEHPTLKPLSERIGMCGSSGNARKNGEKNLWFFNPAIESQLPVPMYTYEDEDHEYDAKKANLKWGTIDGNTIKAEITNCSVKGGTRSSTQEFPKTSQGLKEALDAIREHYR